MSRVMSLMVWLCGVMACVVAVAWGEQAAEERSPSFVAQGEGVYTFNTAVAQGRLEVTDQGLGVTSLIVKGTRVELAGSVGILSHYRLFSGSQRFGDAARGWPKVARLLEDGAVEVRFDTGDLPFEMSCVYRWVSDDTLDLETTITPKRALPDFELFMGSYFAHATRGFLYTQPNQFEEEAARLLPVDVNAMIDGAYLMFPRDPQAARMVLDGRWDQPPHPVRWSIPRWYAGSLGLRRHDALDVAVVVMARPDQCFAIGAPYNKVPHDGPSGHASLYHSLFGRDLKAGEAAKVTMRMIVGRDLSDERILDRYASYVK